MTGAAAVRCLNAIAAYVRGLDEVSPHDLVRLVEYALGLRETLHPEPWRRRSQRLAELVRGGATCRYCRRALRNHGQARDGATWDHVVPVCQGGTDDETNLVIACRYCNSKKGGRTPEQAGMVLQ